MTIGETVGHVGAPPTPTEEKATAKPRGAIALIDRYFGVSAQGSTLSREAVAGLTTFLAMAYILFVNPQVLGDAGMDLNAVFVATASRPRSAPW